MDVQKPCVLVQRLENECRADRVEPRYRVELKERGLHAVLQGLNHQPEARYMNEGFASLRECQAPDVLEHVVVARLGRGLVSLPKNLRREVVRPVVPVASLRPTRRSWRGWGHWRGFHHGVNASDVQRGREGPPNSEAYRELSKEERRRRDAFPRPSHRFRRESRAVNACRQRADGSSPAIVRRGPNMGLYRQASLE